MIRKLISSALLAAAIVGGSFVGTGTANATGSPLVCNGIDEAPSYVDYLINAAVWGKAFDWSSSAQAYNIVSAVNAYCPWHAQGIKNAAIYLSGNNSGDYVA
jgi:hypothetical protein